MAQNEGMDTRDRIFVAAAEMFSTKGYDRVSIREICDRVGVGKPTLYYHFRDKETLLEELVRTALDTARRLAARHIDEHTDFMSKFEHLVRLRYRFAQKYPHMIRFFIGINIFSLPESVQSLMIDHTRWLSGELHRMFRQGEEEGYIRPGTDPEILGLSLMGGLNQLLIYNIARKSRELMSEEDSRRFLDFWKDNFFIQVRQGR